MIKSIKKCRLGGELLKVSVIALATSFYLTACSSDGGSSSSQTGYLIDSAVGGVEYTCGATAGVTARDGSFTCSIFPVTFKIGALTLGSIDSIASDGKVMPQDLVGVSRADIAYNAVLNIASLLQSLDDDANPNNGIFISNAIRASFTSAKNIQTINPADIEALVKSVGKTVVSHTTAMAHLKTNTPELRSSSSSSFSSGSGTSSSSDVTAPTKFSWIYGVESNSTSTLTNRRVSFDESIKTSGISITTSNGGTVADIVVSESNVSFSYKKINTDENLTITGSDLAGNEFNITRGSKIVLKTGQTTSYTENDDGAYQKGVSKSYTDNGNGTVTDNATGLIWQKEDDNAKRDWATAKTYCQGLILGGSSEWRLPSVGELFSIIDRGRSNPAIDTVFTNTKNDNYWSSTTSVANPANAWSCRFTYGTNVTSGKMNTDYVRCIRDY